MEILESLLMAVALCADCFAVSLCSGVTVRNCRFNETLKVALLFGVIQTGLLACGWAFGSLFVGFVEKASHIIGFLLLLYVGGSMLVEAIRGEEEIRDLNGLRNVIIGGIATSIDALAVGVARCMAGTGIKGMSHLLVAVFAVTVLSVVIGIEGGKTIGKKSGRWAEMLGGLVLIGIGVSLLF
ncbi:MAG: manganese efflux pump [Bacteroidales bacterium]|nr:manganese efflux pump [Candidatus Cryptobacteroides choladohippi]MCQ2179616.1 manganese efflux pump [Bacteroidales bacterium]